MPDKIRFGIFGTGVAAEQFAEACGVLADEVVLQGVASRSRERADAFAARWGIAQAYDNYETLSLARNVDVIFVATPHNFHLENMRLAAQNSKNVLCAKPAGISLWETEQMRIFSARNLRFMMEASWMLFLPAWRKLRELYLTGAIGRATTLHAEISLEAPAGRLERLLEPGLAGGALLALGVQNLLAAGELLGFDAELGEVKWDAADSGVDREHGFTLQHANGATSSLRAAIGSPLANQLVLAGDKGTLTLHGHPMATRLVFARNDGDSVTFDYPHRANGMEFGIHHVCGCIRDNKFESDIASFGQSESAMRLSDAVRRSICLLYPFE